MLLAFKAATPTFFQIIFYSFRSPETVFKRTFPMLFTGIEICLVIRKEALQYRMVAKWELKMM